MLAQMCGQGGEAQTLSEMESRCALLRSEIQEVLAEIDAPKIDTSKGQDCVA